MNLSKLINFYSPWKSSKSLFLLKSSEKPWFSDNFRENRSQLIRLTLTITKMELFCRNLSPKHYVFLVFRIQLKDFSRNLRIIGKTKLRKTTMCLFFSKKTPFIKKIRAWNRTPFCCIFITKFSQHLLQYFCFET